MSRLLIRLICVVCLLSTYSYAACDETGGRAGAFLRMPPGARPGGMGNAYVAVVDDGNAIYFNPAGLYQIEGFVVTGTYSIMRLDRKQYQGSFIYSDDRYGSFGAAFMGLGVSEIDGRDSQGNPTETFDDTELAFSGSYAIELAKGVGIGGGLKYISHSLADNSASAIAYDVGFHTGLTFDQGLLRSLSFGASLADLGAELEWDTDSSHKDKIPSVTRVGAAIVVGSERSNVLVALDGSKTSEEDMEVHAGAEARIHQILGFRIGSDRGDINFGVSVRYSGVQFDYALCEDVLDEGSTSRVGVQLWF